MDEKKSLNIDKEIRSILMGIDISIKVFNEELNKAKLSKFHKNLIRECFAYGITSGLLLRIRKLITDLEKRKKHGT